MTLPQRFVKTLKQDFPRRTSLEAEELKTKSFVFSAERNYTGFTMTKN